MDFETLRSQFAAESADVAHYDNRSHDVTIKPAPRVTMRLLRVEFYLRKMQYSIRVIYEIQFDNTMT